MTAHRGEGLNAERRRDRDEPDGESGQAEIRTINNSFTIEFLRVGADLRGLIVESTLLVGLKLKKKL